jgi:hypothetical protein
MEASWTKIKVAFPSTIDITRADMELSNAQLFINCDMGAKMYTVQYRSMCS